jgi:cell division protein FtsI/penicillin-binding protein 2
MGKKNSSIQISNKISEAELDNIIRAFNEDKLPGLIHNFASMRRIYSKGVLGARLMGSVREESNGYDPVTNSRSLYKLAGINGLEATLDKVMLGNMAGGKSFWMPMATVYPIQIYMRRSPEMGTMYI